MRRDSIDGSNSLCVPPINLQDDASSLETKIFQIKRLMAFNKNFTVHLSVDTLAIIGKGNGQSRWWIIGGVSVFTRVHVPPLSFCCRIGFCLSCSALPLIHQ